MILNQERMHTYKTVGAPEYGERAALWLSECMEKTNIQYSVTLLIRQACKGDILGTAVPPQQQENVFFCVCSQHDHG